MEILITRSLGYTTHCSYSDQASLQCVYSYKCIHVRDLKADSGWLLLLLWDDKFRGRLTGFLLYFFFHSHRVNDEFRQDKSNALLSPSTRSSSACVRLLTLLSTIRLPILILNRNSDTTRCPASKIVILMKLRSDAYTAHTCVFLLFLDRAHDLLSANVNNNNSLPKNEIYTYTHRRRVNSCAHCDIFGERAIYMRACSEYSLYRTLYGRAVGNSEHKFE